MELEIRLGELAYWFGELVKSDRELELGSSQNELELVIFGRELVNSARVPEKGSSPQSSAYGSKIPYHCYTL